MVPDKLRMSLEALAIAKEIFPDAEEDFCWYAIWNETGYPEFWNIPEDGDTPAECLRKQLIEYKEHGPWMDRPETTKVLKGELENA